VGSLTSLIILSDTEAEIAVAPAIAPEIIPLIVCYVLVIQKNNAENSLRNDLGCCRIVNEQRVAEALAARGTNQNNANINVSENENGNHTRRKWKHEKSCARGPYTHLQRVLELSTSQIQGN
ncbi:hypothetical protein Tco_1207895, partial [Tanacetum coccineum]